MKNIYDLYRYHELKKRLEDIEKDSIAIGLCLNMCPIP